MKKLLFLLTTLLLTSCSNNVETNATVGEWYRGDLMGKSFKLGEQKNIELLKKAEQYYNDMDAENLVSLFEEDAKIYNYQGDELTANLALFEALFASLDSLEWTPHGMSTQTLEDNSIAVVSIPSTVQLYPKDSEAEGYYTFERFWIVDGKISTVVHYRREFPTNYDEILLLD
ncbi:MAG: hypothetical protein DBW78_04685 [Rhodothermaeota bacterium MED-G64]|nr:MAG: hypothetical protein DBW78_04685 [Rhodothermaeota bacterium MED-G64]|tara:strand:+ start:96 stop:614 length:519 start_codon:yes stop_codon:yes gene_type:complete